MRVSARSALIPSALMSGQRLPHLPTAKRWRLRGLPLSRKTLNAEIDEARFHSAA
jgi:hypothetical protein